MRTSEQIRSTTSVGASGVPNTSSVFCRPASLTTLPLGDELRAQLRDRRLAVGLAGVDALDFERHGIVGRITSPVSDRQA